MRVCVCVYLVVAEVEAHDDALAANNLGQQANTVCCDLVVGQVCGENTGGWQELVSGGVAA